MSALIAALYSLCILLLIGFAAFVFVNNPRAALNRIFVLLSLSLLGWVGSLFAFDLLTEPGTLLWVGRFNFACVALAAPLVYLFVRAVVDRPGGKARLLWCETVAMGAATLLTSGVDQAEVVKAGEHVTVYGPLFWLYILHILAYLTGALIMAFRPPVRTSREVQSQLVLIGTGILVTTLIALVTNAVLPYWFGNFRWIHVGTVSTIFFLFAVGNAVFVHHLFDIHVIIKATFVYTGLVAFTLELYQLAIAFLAHLLPFGDTTERNFAATAFALVINAFTHEPVRRWLEKYVDHVLKQWHRAQNVRHVEP